MANHPQILWLAPGRHVPTRSGVSETERMEALAISPRYRLEQLLDSDGTLRQFVYEVARKRFGIPQATLSLWQPQ